MPISSPDDAFVTPPMTTLGRLIERINEANNTQLNPDDWYFSVPAVNPDTTSKYNTKVTLRAIEGSQTNGATTFFYNRDDLSVVLNGVNIAYDKTTDLLLSQLIARINAAAGTHLSALDYAEQPITVADPLQVAVSEASVMIQANLNSYDYTGSYFLNLLPYQTPDATGVARTTYVAVTEMTGSFRTDVIRALDDIGASKANFNFLHNATDITNFTIRDFVVIPSGNLILDGSFILSVSMNNQPPAALMVSRLTIAPDGGVIGFDSLAPYGGTDAAVVAHNPNRAESYVVDGTGNLGSKANRLYRFDDEGSQNGWWNATGLSYIPAAVALCDDGKLYTASSVFTAPVATNNNIPGQQIRIDRLLDTGELDSTFEPVIITANALSAPPQVVSLKPVAGGVWVVFLPSGDASSATPTPIINGVQSVEHTDSANEFGYIPIYFFDNQGQWAVGFANEKRNLSPKAIYDSTNSSLSVGQEVLNVYGSKVVFFTNRVNPITGKLGRQLLRFSLAGYIVPLSGDAYLVQPEWTSNTGIVALSNGDFLIGGTAKVPYPGGVTAEIVVVIRFNYDSTLKRVLYTETFQAGQPSKAVIRIRVFETVV